MPEEVPFLVPVPWPLILAGGLLLAVFLVGLVVLVYLIRGRRDRREPSVPLERIHVVTLGMSGPPAEGPRAEIYGTPVRIAVVVVAAVGRSGELPPEHDLPIILNDVVPGLKQVIQVHRPTILRWPEQLSAQGFTQAFFGNVVLPGDRGKGTPWSSLAGRFTSGGESYLVGLACCASESNALGQVAIEHEGQWLDVLRVRAAEE